MPRFPAWLGLPGATLPGLTSSSRTVAASSSRGRSTARPCRLPSCQPRAGLPVTLRFGRRPCRRRAPTRFRSAYHRVAAPPPRRRSDRRSSRIAEMRTSVELGIPAPRGGPKLGQLRTSRLAWVRDGGSPGRFRPMYATHDSIFKVGHPSSRRTSRCVPRIVETPGFTPGSRFGELASTTGVSSRRFGWSVPSDASSPRGQFAGALRDERAVSREVGPRPWRSHELGSNPLV